MKAVGHRSLPEVTDLAPFCTVISSGAACATSPLADWSQVYACLRVRTLLSGHELTLVFFLTRQSVFQRWDENPSNPSIVFHYGKGFRKLRHGRGRVSELRADPCPAGGDVSQPKAVLLGGGGEDRGHRQAVTGGGQETPPALEVVQAFPTKFR